MKLLALLLPALIFQPGPKYFREEAPRRTEGWLGLYCRQTCALRPAVLEYRTFEDEPDRLDAESKPRQALFLFRDVPGLAAGPVTAVQVAASELPRNAAVRLGAEYELRVNAAGDVALHHGGVAQTVYRMPAFVDEPQVTLRFAGDLDRDGKLDLIMTNSWKYSYVPLQLYLSSAAAPGELVREVARLDRYGC